MNALRWFWEAPNWVTWCAHFLIGLGAGLAFHTWWLPVVLYGFREAGEVLYTWPTEWTDHVMDVAAPGAASLILWMVL